MRKLGKSGNTIGTVARTRRDRFFPGKVNEFDYIEIGDVRPDGTATSSRVLATEAPSRASQCVGKNDVITSTVRPIRRLTALISSLQDGFVCSSGFVVLQPTGVAPEVLLTYLRLPDICELMDLHTSASLYPAIAEADLLALPFHPIDKASENSIVTAVQTAQATRRAAYASLEIARKAIEVAVEEGEAAAFTYIKEH
jgi:hypothetical protein